MGWGNRFWQLNCLPLDFVPSCFFYKQVLIFIKQMLVKIHPHTFKPLQKRLIAWGGGTDFSSWIYLLIYFVIIYLFAAVQK